MPACYDPVKILRQEVGRLTQILPRQVLPQAPLFGFLPRGMYPIGMGRTLTMMRYLPSRFPKTTSTYSNMFQNQPYAACTSNDEPCTPSLRQLGAISETLTWAPKWTGWKSPQFCHNDLVTDYNISEQLANVFSVVTDNVAQDIEREHYLDLVAAAANTVVLTGTEGEAITPNIFERGAAANVDATCPLTMGALEYANQHGWRRGAYGSASAQSIFGVRNGRPQSLLITSAEVAAQIVQSDVRARSVDGYRGSYDVQSLFQPSGSTFLSKYGIRSYNGFNFLEIAYPRRGTMSHGTFTPVVDSVADENVPQDCVADSSTVVNPDWEDPTTAPVEEALLLLRNDIIEIQTFPIVASPGGEISFSNVTNLLGQWEYVNWRDCQENPFGLRGYAQALHAYAAKPLSTYAAYKIYFTRCPIAGNCGPCS